MFKNQKGLTTIELLISVLILSIVIASTGQFYNLYKQKINSFGSHNTARNLAISVLELELESTKIGDVSTGIVYATTVYIKGQKYTLKAIKTDMTTSIDYYSSSIPYYKINSSVSWGNKKVEVAGYVSSR